MHTTTDTQVDILTQMKFIHPLIDIPVDITELVTLIITKTTLTPWINVVHIFHHTLTYRKCGITRSPSSWITSSTGRLLSFKLIMI